MGPRPQCYIPMPKVIGLLVLEKTFEGFLPYMGVAAILGHVTQTPRTNFRSPDPWRLHMKFGFNWPSGFEEEDLWKWWTDGQRTTEHAYTISSLMGNISSPMGELKGELKMKFKIQQVKICVLAKNDPPNDKTNKMACAPSENWDQPGSESSLCARWVAKDPSFLHVDSEDWSDWVDAQADQSLRLAHRPFCWLCHDSAHVFNIKQEACPEPFDTEFNIRFNHGFEVFNIWCDIDQRIPILTEAIAEVNIGILWSISHHIQYLNRQQLFYYITITINLKTYN